jgi:hypothetical protein
VKLIIQFMLFSSNKNFKLEQTFIRSFIILYIHTFNIEEKFFLLDGFAYVI